MSREIKFRVWDKTRWLYQDEFIISDGECKELIIGGWKSRNDVVIQQYIGSKDKTGNEIYEGDLLLFEGSPLLPEKFRVEYIYAVDFYDGSFKIPYMYRRMKGSDVVEVTGRSKLNNFDRLEIIGNINENPLNIL